MTDWDKLVKPFDVCSENDKNSVWDGPRDEKDNPLPWRLTPSEPIKSFEWPRDNASIIYSGVDLGASDKTATTIIKDGKIEKVYNNIMPTHDPYTNPDAQIYYQCNCGAILDPGTKSFAALNNCASDKGWKIRWGQNSYVPYCVDCGKDVE